MKGGAGQVQTCLDQVDSLQLCLFLFIAFVQSLPSKETRADPQDMNA